MNKTTTKQKLMVQKLTDALKLLKEQYSDWNREPASNLIRNILGLNVYQTSAIFKLKIIQDNIPEVEKRKGTKYRGIGTSYKWNSIDYPEVDLKLVELIRSTCSTIQKEYMDKYIAKKNNPKFTEDNRVVRQKLSLSTTKSIVHPVENLEEEEVGSKFLGLPLDFALLLKNLVCIEEKTLRIEVESGERGMNKSSFNFSVNKGLLVKIHRSGLEILTLHSGELLTSITCLTFRKLSVSRKDNWTMILKIN